ncbi:MAG: PQQ-binding-like beta-propeller repeat protein [Planctomycetota bacterium]
MLIRRRTPAGCRSWTTPSLAVLMCAAVVLLGACGGPSKGPGPAPRPVGGGGADLAIEYQAAADLGFLVGWDAGVRPRSGQRISTATLLGDLLVIGQEPENRVFGLDAATGEVLWASVLGDRREVLFPPVREGDRVYFGSDVRLYVLEARTGDRVDVREFPFTATTPPIPVPGGAVIGTLRGLVASYNLAGGFPNWRYQLPQKIESRPVATEREVFASDRAGNYVLLDAANGEPIWRNRTFGAVRAAPSLSGSEVLVPSLDHTLYALNRVSGLDTWVFRADRPLTERAFVAGRTVLLPLPGSGIQALDAFAGEKLWFLDRPDAKPAGLSSSGGRILLYEPGRLLDVSLADGEVVGETPTAALHTALDAGNGQVILVGARGQVARLRPIEP